MAHPNGNRHHHHAANGANQADGEYDHDSTESVDSLSSEEIESHFVQRYNRQFHSQGNRPSLPYPLPVDALEGSRMDFLHETLQMLLGGSNYFGPVEQVLATPTGGRRRRALDICTGNGKWVDEMAEEFPNVKFYGIDIVPLATRYPADNVQYEVHDINHALRWRSGRFDLVHMRQSTLTVRNYRGFLSEIARIIRPGGLFLSGEWIRGIIMQDGSDPNTSAGGVHRFFQTFMHLMGRRGINTIASQIPALLQQNGNFVNITPNQIQVPLDNTVVGTRLKWSIRMYAESARPLLFDSGYTPMQVQRIMEELNHDLEDVAGMVVVYYTVHAKKALN